MWQLPLRTVSAVCRIRAVYADGQSGTYYPDDHFAYPEVSYERARLSGKVGFCLLRLRLE